MNKFSLDSSMQIEVTARFINKGTDEPLKGADYELRLYEKDLMQDDYLGRSSLDENGIAKITFTHKDFGDNFNIEQMPDLYFALYKNEALIFQSKVMEDIDIEAIKKIKIGEGKIVDLGTFLV